jgi:O-Antigen ligase
VLLSLVLVAAAMPLRIADNVPVVNSLSILDILLVCVGFTLFLDLAYRPLDVGYRQVFWLLSVPFLLAVASLYWSQDRGTTIRSILIYVEGIVVYLFVVRELDGLPPYRIIRYMERYAYLLVIPAVFLLLHVPGFEPRVGDDVSRTSGDYLTYFTRLSHPVLGGSNNLASILALLAPILLYWGQVRSNRRATLAGGVALLAIFLTLSRGMLLSFVIAGLLYGMVALIRPGRAAGGGSSRLWKRLAAIVGLGITAIALFYLFNPTTHGLIKDRFTLANVNAREGLIADAWTKIEHRPFLGYGSGVAPDGDLLLKEGVHNAFLQQIIYYGVPLGVAISLVLCGLAGFFLARRTVTPLAGVMGFALMAELISFLFESTFEGTVLRVLIYMCIGLMVGLLRAVETGRLEQRSLTG